MTATRNQEEAMIDLQIQSFDFAATSVSVSPVSAAGKAFFEKNFGTACVSVELPKSALPRFCDAAECAGLVVR
jgi:NADH:ubiquinone oxidoreductase subunit B-like Fe-S oxidoreductase